MVIGKASALSRTGRRRAHERMARRHYDLLNSTMPLVLRPSPFALRPRSLGASGASGANDASPSAPYILYHPLTSSHSMSLLRKLTVILWRLSAYISRRP